jgi:hypothetical protein
VVVLLLRHQVQKVFHLVAVVAHKTQEVLLTLHQAEQVVEELLQVAVEVLGIQLHPLLEL